MCASRLLKALAIAALFLGMGSAPALAITVQFDFDFDNDTFDSSGLMTFDNDPGAGLGFTESFDNLVNLSIVWAIPSTGGFDEGDLVGAINAAQLLGFGTTPTRTFILDNVIPTNNVEWLNGSGDSLTFITDGSLGDGTGVILTPFAGLPIGGTFVANEVVPEPSSLSLLALGLLGLAIRRERS